MAACIHMGLDIKLAENHLAQPLREHILGCIERHEWHSTLIEGRNVAGRASRSPLSNMRGASTCVISEIHVHIKTPGLILSFGSRSALSPRQSGPASWLCYLLPV